MIIVTQLNFLAYLFNACQNVKQTSNKHQTSNVFCSRKLLTSMNKRQCRKQKQRISALFVSASGSVVLSAIYIKFVFNCKTVTLVLSEVKA